ncbi:MAG TPA: hypothetical protein ENN42_07880 [Thioalkalivibrio sp.]|nr:hypothetical protein [Thioalkalivibrio sp.]
MTKKHVIKPAALTLGAAFAGSMAGQAVAADANPFALTDLGGGYMVADNHAEGRCGEGKCGGTMTQDQEKTQEGKCGEGKCGEGKCGEGKCGTATDEKTRDKAGEGKCGGSR